MASGSFFFTLRFLFRAPLDFFFTITREALLYLSRHGLATTAVRLIPSVFIYGRLGPSDGECVSRGGFRMSRNNKTSAPRAT